MTRPILFCSSLLMAFIEAFYLGHSLPLAVFMLASGLLVVSAGLFLVLNRGISLAVVLAEILGIGFSLVFFSWITQATIQNQSKAIFLHFSISLTLVFLWISGQYIRELALKNKELQQKVLLLEKDDPETGVLTFQEFLYRLEEIWIGLKRRNEEGFLLKISLSPSISHAKQAYLVRISRTALQSIRKFYDIVTVSPQGKIYMALQNTDEFGMKIVQSRFLEALAEDLSIEAINLITIHCAKFDLDCPNAKEWLDSTILDKKFEDCEIV